MSTPSQTSVTPQRVKLLTNLERYGFGLLPGVYGWTEPARPAIWGVVVRFDNNCLVDVLHTQLAVISPETQEQQMPTDAEIVTFISATSKHRERVAVMMRMVAAQILTRSDMHDLSKLEEPELSGFTASFGQLKASTYGSEEYAAALKSLGPALEHHYKHNSHHPEHFENGMSGMNLLDLLEMFIDWVAATKNHDDGDILKSIEVNTKRFDIPPMVVQILKNTARDFLGVQVPA